MKFIFLNGPPRSGKDTAALAIKKAFHGVARLGFADHLKEATHAAYGLRNSPYDAFEKVKDEPRAEFFGLTPRQAYIAHSENYMKPLHGSDVFGRIFLRRAEVLGADMVIVPDSGFASEALPVIEKYRAANCLLIHVDADDRGKSFAGDSRSYIRLPGVRTIKITNNGEQADYETRIVSMVSNWLEYTEAA